MKRSSIRAKITLWFALAMSALAALTLGCVWMISDNVVQKTSRTLWWKWSVTMWTR